MPTTLWPFATSPSAIARPIPRVAPVTKVVGMFIGCPASARRFASGRSFYPYVAIPHERNSRYGMSGHSSLHASVLREYDGYQNADNAGTVRCERILILLPTS